MTLKSVEKSALNAIFGTLIPGNNVPVETLVVKN